MEPTETSHPETTAFVDRVANLLIDNQNLDRPDGMSHEQWRWNSLENLTTRILETLDEKTYMVSTHQDPNAGPDEYSCSTIHREMAPLLQPRLEHLRVAYTQATLNELLPRPED